VHNPVLFRFGQESIFLRARFPYGCALSVDPIPVFFFNLPLEEFCGLRATHRHTSSLHCPDAFPHNTHTVPAHTIDQLSTLEHNNPSPINPQTVTIFKFRLGGSRKGSPQTVSQTRTVYSQSCGFESNCCELSFKAVVSKSIDCSHQSQFETLVS
jgi:hypothetical protein